MENISWKVVPLSPPAVKVIPARYITYDSISVYLVIDETSIRAIVKELPVSQREPIVLIDENTTPKMSELSGMTTDELYGLAYTNLITKLQDYL